MTQSLPLGRLTQTQFTPKYVNLAKKLLRQIAHEGLRPGDRLGTELELGRKHGVSRITVRQALAVLEKDGYVSREKARGTFVKATPDNTRQLGLVRGVVVVACSNEQASHAQEDFAFSTVLRAIERTLTKQGFTVQILGVGEDETLDRARLEQLHRRGDVEGICAIGPCLEPYKACLGDIRLVTSCSFHSSLLPLVAQDVREVCRESVGYLLACGHRDIAILCGPWIDRDAFAILVTGYKEAFAAAGASPRRHLLYHALPGEPIVDLACEVLNAPTKPTAIWAENWKVCQAVLAATARLGLQIPRDLSLVGYGQNVLQMASPIAITTYVPDSERIGQKAAECLIAGISGEAVPKTTMAIRGKLIERNSVRRLDAPADTEARV